MYQKTDEQKNIHPGVMCDNHWLSFEMKPPELERFINSNRLEFFFNLSFILSLSLLPNIANI